VEFQWIYLKNYKNPLYQQKIGEIRKKTKDKDLINENAFRVHQAI
jgi:hypothetical protein